MLLGHIFADRTIHTFRWIDKRKTILGNLHALTRGLGDVSDKLMPIEKQIEAHETQTF